MFLRGRDTVPSMQLMAHTRETMGRKHVSLMRLFVTHFSGSQDLPLEPYWETIIRQLTATSAAATFSSSPVWQYVAARTCSPSPAACSSVAVISSVDTVLFAKQLLFSMPKGFVRAFGHTRFSHTQMFKKTLVFENALLGARGCRKKLKPFLCQSWLFAAAMEWSTQDGSRGDNGPSWL